MSNSTTPINNNLFCFLTKWVVTTGKEMNVHFQNCWKRKQHSSDAESLNLVKLKLTVTTLRPEQQLADILKAFSSIIQAKLFTFKQMTKIMPYGITKPQ